jgi:hypothetical protein
VISRDINRRHLTTQQRAAIAAELATMKVGDNQHTRTEPPSNDGPSVEQVAATASAMSTEQAALTMKVSPKSVERAKKRMRDDPTAHAKAKAGSLERKKSRPASPKNTGADEKASTKLVAAVRSLNVAWPMQAIVRVKAETDEGQRSELRQHLPDLIDKLQRIAEPPKMSMPGITAPGGRRANG